MNQTPLNPDALEAAARAMVGCAFSKAPNIEELKDARWELWELWERDARATVSAYLAVAQPVVNSVEELDVLPQETVIRSVIFGVVRERMDSGWLATGADEFESTDEIAGRDHIVLHRPEVNDA